MSEPVQALQFAQPVACKIKPLGEEYALETFCHHCSASIDLMLHCGAGFDADRIIRDADEAMYRVKRNKA